MLWLLCALLPSPALAEEGGWKQLHAPSAQASSYLKSNWNRFTENYHPTYILDGNPRTAWVEGAPGNGEGSWVEWPLSRVASAKRVKVRIRNGYHKSAKLLTANAAPRQVRLDLLSQGQVVHSQQAGLKRDLSWQEVVLTPSSPVAVDSVRITVLAAHTGSAYADLCISDVETWVDGDGVYSAAVENAKKKAAAAWIASRVAAAEAFANVKPSYPFAATQFKSDHTYHAPNDPPPPPIPNADALGRELSGLLQTGPWYRLDVRRKVPLPEDLEELDFAANWFSTDRGLFEAKDEWRSHKKGADEWHTLSAVTNIKVRYAADGRTPAAVAYKTRNTYEERSTFTTTDEVLVHFDAQGRPVRIYVSNVNNGYEICDRYEGVRYYEISRSNGKIDRVTKTATSRCTKPMADLDPRDMPTEERESATWTPKG